MLGIQIDLPKIDTGPFHFAPSGKARSAKRLPFDSWLHEVSPTFTWDWAHLAYIRRQLDRVTAGEVKRLMLFMPPRHGKSEQVTVRYPVWRLKCDPTLRVIVGAYNQTLVNRFSRKSRRLAQGQIELSEDRAAVEEWETAAGGTFRAVGVGSGITGQGGDLVIIDDPVKSREEANSETYRERVWDWYTDDLYTRLEPDAAIILIMCMTGDTPVLMADGTERPLREIKVGDQVATYDNGRLATSIVKNHRSNGLDSIFRIKTTCGKIVHANERHPFLVQENGQLKWIRLRNLTMAHRIVTVRGNGASGKARPAVLRDAKNLSARGATAPHITAKSIGQTEIALRLPVRNRAATYASSTATELLLPNTMPCLRLKAASVPFVGNRQGTTCARIGAANCALITATKRTRSEGFCATTVTLRWDTPRRRQPHSPLLNISDFTTAQIESIDPAGVEEVFDIQIDRTENFIANGLVSHNTRWHSDDLAGRILASEDGPQWTVISLPAEAEKNDPLGRTEGAALCPERYDLAALARIHAILGNSYYALYQQRPTPLEGGMFKRPWFEIVDAAPFNAERVRYWDKAGTAGGGAYSCGVLMCRDTLQRFCIEDVVRGQWSALEREQVIKQTAMADDARYGQVAIWQEQEPGSGGKESAEATVRNLAGHIIHTERVTGDKVTRAEPYAAQCEGKNVKLVKGAWNGAYLEELTGFPHGKYKDQVDASSGAFNKLANIGMNGQQLATAFGWQG